MPILFALAEAAKDTKHFQIHAMINAFFGIWVFFLFSWWICGHTWQVPAHGYSSPIFLRRQTE